ncbi:hypothetical protein IPH25_04060 [bacterium]|nr:MAG: hypothetical protein IPG37_01055 [bacterium]QQR61621.1 MAG: hypothetical protein IPH25_04060 [bacterium]QQR62819.1 MAG: hypothetical protein IPH67_05425 [bacterium]
MKARNLLLIFTVLFSFDGCGMILSSKEQAKPNEQKKQRAEEIFGKTAFEKADNHKNITFACFDNIRIQGLAEIEAVEAKLHVPLHDFNRLTKIKIHGWNLLIQLITPACLASAIPYCVLKMSDNKDIVFWTASTIFLTAYSCFHCTEIIHIDPAKIYKKTELFPLTHQQENENRIINQTVDTIKQKYKEKLNTLSELISEHRGFQNNLAVFNREYMKIVEDLSKQSD